jgi:NADP-dependent alcohol dehydrogenase
MPGVLRHQVEKKRAKLAQLGARVFGVDGAEAAIDRVEAFFRSIGIPTRLSEHGVDAAEAAERIAARFAERGAVWGEHRDLDPAAVRRIVLSRA